MAKSTDYCHDYPKTVYCVPDSLHREVVAERDRLRAELEALKSNRAYVVMETTIRQLEGENETLRDAIYAHREFIESAGTVQVADVTSEIAANRKHAADQRLWRCVQSDETEAR